MTRIVVGMFWVVLMVLGAGSVSSQSYPNKPIRIVTGPVGGNEDITTRIIAQRLSSSLGQSIVVDNRASGFIPGEIVSRATPDGHTLLVTGGNFWIGALLQTAPFDPVRDFLPISMLSMSPNVLVVHPSLPAKSVKELIALAKAKPGELNNSSGPAGGQPHLTGELFKAMAGVNIVRVPFTGAGPAMIALMGGQVQLGFHATTSVSPHVKSGRLRALAVTSAQPSALAPGLPTVAASGLPGFESAQLVGMFALAKTPDAIIRRLNQEITRGLNQADVKEKFLNSGTEVASSSPEQFGAAIKADMTKWGKLIKDADIRAE